jgi:hypothetical protein
LSRPSYARPCPRTPGGAARQKGAAAGLGESSYGAHEGGRHRRVG